MEAIDFPQRTHILAENQPEYTPLPVHIDRTQPGSPFTCCFKLSPEEIEQINKTGEIWYTQLTCGNLFQPVMLSVINPFT